MHLKFSPWLIFPSQLIILFSCKEVPKIIEKEKTAALDTENIIATSNIQEVRFDSALMNHDPNIKELKKEIITADFVNMRWACTCPDWCYWEHQFDKQPEIDSFCVYMEPASSDLSINGKVVGFFNKITFTGRFYRKKDSPPLAYYQIDDPKFTPVWYIFRYYGYKINKPYTFYGPDVFDKEDSINVSSEITVKK